MVGQLYKTLYFHSWSAPTYLEWPCREQRGSNLTASAQVWDASPPVRTNGLWPLARPVSVAQKNKPSTMLSSNVPPTDLIMYWRDCTAWQFWTMRQSNGFSTPAPRSSAAKQWIAELSQTTNKKLVLMFWWNHLFGKEEFPVFECRGLCSWCQSVRYDVQISDLVLWFIHFSFKFVCFLCFYFIFLIFYP